MAVLKCLGGEGPSNAVKSVVVLGIALTISFVLLLVAGIVGKNWLPMINLGAIVLVPIAVIISDVMGGSSGGMYDESKQAWMNFGACLLGVILASLVGLPLVLLHVNQLNNLAFGLWIGSTAVTFAASVWYWVARHSEE